MSEIDSSGLPRSISRSPGDDDVHVPTLITCRTFFGGRSRKTSEIDMDTGDRNTFWIRLSALVPVTGAIEVRVYESDVFRDDLISILDLIDAPKSDNRPWDDAEYHVTAEFDR